MPTRDYFPKAYFDGNPYDGVSVEEMYEKLRWGNKPEQVFEIEGPEDMATVGTVAKIVTSSGVVEYSEEEAPFLAIGRETNRLYIVPFDSEGGPCDIPEGGYTELAEIRQIDYYSDKGGEEAYYYHEHEAPFPTLYLDDVTGVAVIEPAEMDDGSRSYAVGDEGVIG